MQPFTITVVLIGIAIAIVVTMRLLAAGRAFPYVRRTALLTPAEQAFHAVLEKAVGDKFRVMAMVRLGDIIAVREGHDGKDRRRAWNRIFGKHVDFVLCDPADFTIVCAVELDDASHRQANRMERDSFVDQAMKAAGLPLLHVQVRQKYDAGELRKTIRNCIESTPEPAAQPTGGTSAAPICPNCKIEMVVRTARNGDKFWGCHNFPKCRARRDVDGG